MPGIVPQQSTPYLFINKNNDSALTEVLRHSPFSLAG